MLFIGDMPCASEGFGIVIQGETHNDWIQQALPEEWHYCVACGPWHAAGDGWVKICFDGCDSHDPIMFSAMQCEVLHGEDVTLEDVVLQGSQSPESG